jgi:hypothetical protein
MIVALRERGERTESVGFRLGYVPKLYETLLTVEKQQLVARINGNRVEQTNKRYGRGGLNNDSHEILRILRTSAQPLVVDLLRQVIMIMRCVRLGLRGKVRLTKKTSARPAGCVTRL